MKWMQIAVVIGLVGWMSMAQAAAEKVEGEAPPNHVILKNTRGGAYFIARGLKERYDRLLGRVRALRADLEDGKIGGAEAERQLENLEVQLRELRREIDAKKVLVSPLALHRETETTTFNLGAEGLLVITGDNVHVVGWEGPGVKCVLEKTILAPEGESAEADLKGLQVVHQAGPAAEIVGRSAAEREAEEKRFLASPEGQKLSDAARRGRARVVAEIAAGYAIYERFQGKAIDTVSVKGLSFEEGNRQVTVELRSRGGEGSMGGDWRRHASLTVYVPACAAVAVRGCLVSLEVEQVHAAVILTRQGSRDRDYDGTFKLHDVEGPVVVDNVPLDQLENVRGNVTIRSTVELVNTGTAHENGVRTFYTPPARSLVCRGIEGDVTAHFGRSDLTLERISGRIDVQNDFGNTAFRTAGALKRVAHRIVSQSGRVDVRLAPEARKGLPMLALTECGTVTTNAPQSELEDTSFSIGADATGAARAWRGARSKSGDPFESMQRVSAAIEGRDRPPGLDLISRGGIVRLAYEK